MGVGVGELPVRMSEEAICANLLKVGSLELGDVDGDISVSEAPFHYSSGNFGPGYVDVKSTVAVQRVFKPIVEQVAVMLIEDEVEFDNIAGNVTGGVPPAYQTREDYQRLTGRDDIEYVYVRGSRKQGGKGELVTGIQHIKPTRPDGSPAHFLVMEELVNFSETTVNSSLVLRDLGFVSRQAATILEYGHAAARARLEESDVTLHALTSLATLLDTAVETRQYPRELVERYREFLADPPGWMAAHGLVNTPHEKG